MAHIVRAAKFHEAVFGDQLIERRQIGDGENRRGQQMARARQQARRDGIGRKDHVDLVRAAERFDLHGRGLGHGLRFEAEILIAGAEAGRGQRTGFIIAEQEDLRARRRGAAHDAIGRLKRLSEQENVARRAGAGQRGKSVVRKWRVHAEVSAKALPAIRDSGRPKAGNPFPKRNFPLSHRPASGQV